MKVANKAWISQDQPWSLSYTKQIRRASLRVKPCNNKRTAQNLSTNKYMAITYQRKGIKRKDMYLRTMILQSSFKLTIFFQDGLISKVLVQSCSYKQIHHFSSDNLMEPGRCRHCGCLIDHLSKGSPRCIARSSKLLNYPRVSITSGRASRAVCQHDWERKVARLATLVMVLSGIRPAANRATSPFHFKKTRAFDSGKANKAPVLIIAAFLGRQILNKSTTDRAAPKIGLLNRKNENTQGLHRGIKNSYPRENDISTNSSYNKTER